MKSEEEIIREVSDFVKEAVQKHDNGHGWSHIERVVRLALHIHDREGRGDRMTVELGALLHDVGDHKFAAHDGPAEIRSLLGRLGVNDTIIEEVVSINENISFSKGREDMIKSDELQIVQDADRLDAIGAIGIARAFSYGGFRGREIYDPRADLAAPPGLASASSHSASTVHHFYDKLLMLREMMNTPTGRKLADERHDFMVRYLNQFFREWNPCNDL
ncbi:MAG: HD domain-containing protein [Bacteroidales bacterium]